MSDYLWDKTGEPEADVEELENLLGALKYQPRPLEIPATAMPNVARPVTTTTTMFSRPRLAIAASLILMLLAGTWFVTRQDEQPIRLAEVEQANPTPESRQTQTAVVVKPETGNDAPVNHNDHPKQREDKRVIIATTAPKPHRSSRQLMAKHRQLPSRVKEDAALPPREEVAFTQEEGREATEKLMLALRLASAKLNFAQREVREINRVEK